MNVNLIKSVFAESRVLMTSFNNIFLIIINSEFFLMFIILSVKQF